MDEIYDKIERSACDLVENIMSQNGWEDTTEPVRVDITLCADEDDKYYKSHVVATILAGEFIVSATEVIPIGIDEYISLRTDSSLN